MKNVIKERRPFLNQHDHRRALVLECAAAVMPDIHSPEDVALAVAAFREALESVLAGESCEAMVARLRAGAPQ